MKTATCGNCNVFRAGPKGSKGTCFLTPPTPVLAGMQQDALGRPQPVVAALRPMVASDEFCGMWQPVATPMAPPDPRPVVGLPDPRPVVGLPDPRHAGSDTFTGWGLVPRQVTDPVERAARPWQAHRPVKVTGEWHCADCQAAGDALDTTPCPGKPADAETSE